jgi:hypothetical protein
METGKADRAGRGKPKNISGKCFKPPTLKELGISDNLAHRARRAAAMSQEDFDALIADQRQQILDNLADAIFYPESEKRLAEIAAENEADREAAKKEEEEIERRHRAKAGADDEIGVPLVEVETAPAPVPTKKKPDLIKVLEDKIAFAIYDALADGLPAAKVFPVVRALVDKMEKEENKPARATGSEVQTDDERREQMAALDA